MPQVDRTVQVPYDCRQMFDLVADVQRYPEFMPWCGGSEVQWRDESGMQASIQIRFAGLSQSFTTRNEHDYPNRIVFHLVEGPFSNLTGYWEFQPMPHGCKITYTMEYDFSSRTIALIIGPVFNRIAASFVDSFTQRAHDIYGSKHRQSA